VGYYHPMNALYGERGDPGFLKGLKKRLKIPKGIRKLTLGKALSSPLAGLLPGPLGGLARQFGGGGCGERGDPGFLGDLFKGAGRVISGAFKGGASSALEQRAAQILGSPGGRAVVGGVASGVAGAGLGALLSRTGGRRGGARTYRRLNPLNVHALNRSIRRLKAFNKLHAAIHAPANLREVGKGTMKRLGVRKRRRR
jgi:hypothetical protein